MAYNLGNIVTKVQQRIRDAGYSSQEITNYVNDTINDIYNEYRLPFMQASEEYALTADNPDITSGVGLPANYVQALDLFLTSPGRQRVLIYTDTSQIDAKFPSPDDTQIHPASVPRYWYLFEGAINVYPVPIDNLSVMLRYYKKPTELTGNDDVPEVPSEFSEILVLGAAYRILQIKDNYDQASILQNKYDEVLQKLVVKYSVPQTAQPARLRVNRFFNRSRSF